MSNFGVRVQEKGQVTIPSKIRRRLNLKQGDLVVFAETASGVMLQPASVISADDRKEEFKAIVHSIRERFKQYSAEDIESLVEKAVREVRGKGS